MMEGMLVFVFYVPKEKFDLVTKACFDAKAGEIGNYTNCCWSSEGAGQFMPIKNSAPVIGELDQLTKIVEVRVEMICKRHQWPAIKAAFLANHPYETPVYFTFLSHDGL